MENSLRGLELKKQQVMASRPKPTSFDNLCKSYDTGYTGNDVLQAWESNYFKRDPMFKALMSTNSGPLTVPRTSPLMVENMDGTMTEVLITGQHLKILNSLVRVPSAGPIFEYNRHKGYGDDQRNEAAFGEGGGPTGGVSQFARQYATVKFYGVLGGITHQMETFGMNGGTIEDPDTRENADRGMQLLTKMEREVVFADDLILDNKGNSVKAPGLMKQLATLNPGNIIDMQGKPFTYANVDAAVSRLVTDGFIVDVTGFTMFQSVHVLEGLNQMYQDRNVIRHDKQERQGVNYIPGLKVPGYDSQFGFMEFEPSIMLEEVKKSAPVPVASPDSPAAPATVTPIAAADATSLMDADTWYYSVSAAKDEGESLATISAGVPVAAGQKVTITIARVAAATNYRIYRGRKADGSDAMWIGRIPNTAAADPTFVDLNGWRTKDTNGNLQNGMVIVQKSIPSDLCFAQAMPLMKLPLPLAQTTAPFYLMLYGVPVLKAHERYMIFKNCGTYVSP